MSTFGKIQVGVKFTFNGRTYTKMDETTGVSILENIEKVHFFAGDEQIETE
jgi:hypothetical protein